MAFSLPLIEETSEHTYESWSYGTADCPGRTRRDGDRTRHRQHRVYRHRDQSPADGATAQGSKNRFADGDGDANRVAIHTFTDSPG